ncbi:hypothetical protein ACRTC3_15185 [Photobacterium damselae]|uniref:hypothetical protein n=1 Tax=Photobacterium damselae TaxID=38293 RepID=UPI003D7CF9FD
MNKFFFGVLLLLTGCANPLIDLGGNFNNVSLTQHQAKQITDSVAKELKQRFYARAVFDFPHDPNNVFAASLEQSLRSQGMGVAISDQSQYRRLRYRLDALNDTQFFIQIDVGDVHFQRIWILEDEILAPLVSTANFEGGL